MLHVLCVLGSFTTSKTQEAKYLCRLNKYVPTVLYGSMGIGVHRFFRIREIHTRFALQNNLLNVSVYGWPLYYMYDFHGTYV